MADDAGVVVEEGDHATPEIATVSEEHLAGALLEVEVPQRVGVRHLEPAHFPLGAAFGRPLLGLSHRLWLMRPPVTFQRRSDRRVAWDLRGQHGLGAGLGRQVLAGSLAVQLGWLRY